MISNSIQFSIQTGLQDFDQKLAFARDHDLGLEVAAFASGELVHKHLMRAQAEMMVQAGLVGFGHPRSYHGAFIDLSVHSQDPAIAQISRARIARDLETASFLGCTSIVFHTGFSPLVPVPEYEQDFVARQSDFWRQMAEQWPAITICLENMWEPCPGIIRRLMHGINHPRVGVCLDVAHAHAYSQIPLDTWIDELKEVIVHWHWNDNHGDLDTHLPIGEGNLPWKTVLAGLGTVRTSSQVVLELKSLGAVRKSLDYLAGMRDDATPHNWSAPHAEQAEAKLQSAGLEEGP